MKSAKPEPGAHDDSFERRLTQVEEKLDRVVVYAKWQHRHFLTLLEGCARLEASVLDDRPLIAIAHAESAHAHERLDDIEAEFAQLCRDMKETMNS